MNRIIQLQLELPLDYTLSRDYARRAWREMQRAMMAAAEARCAAGAGRKAGSFPLCVDPGPDGWM